MPAPDVHTRLLQPLNATRVAYMVTGGLAAIIYGEPRLTNDIDIVLRLEPEAADVETSLRADVYCLGGDPLGAWAMERRRGIPIAGANIWVAPIEYVILRKLE